MVYHVIELIALGSRRSSSWLRNVCAEIHQLSVNIVNFVSRLSKYAHAREARIKKIYEMDEPSRALDQDSFS